MENFLIVFRGYSEPLEKWFNLEIYVKSLDEFHFFARLTFKKYEVIESMEGR